MVSVVRPEIPILFVDTGFIFPETHSYRSLIVKKFDLTKTMIVQASLKEIALGDHDGLLHRIDSQACCDLRKVRPLDRALKSFDSWISGRKRFQGHQREALDIFERDDQERIKINPLAYWERDDIERYIKEQNLPRHPLVEQGYPSIGCTLCTTTVESGETVRAGRWRGSPKTECGIHFFSGGDPCSD